MKKSLITLLSAALLTACGSSGSLLSGGTKMNTVDATQQVVEALKKNIDFNEWKVYEVRWMEGEELENNLLLVSVEMINKTNNCFTQSFLLSGPGAGPSELRKATGGMGLNSLTFDAVKGITPEMINPEAIQKQYTEALAMIPEQYEFRSIGDYSISESIPSGNKVIDRGKTFGEAKADFTVNVIEIGKEYVESAGKKSIQYYDMDFNILPDGSVEMDE